MYLQPLPTPRLSVMSLRQCVFFCSNDSSYTDPGITFKDRLFVTAQLLCCAETLRFEISVLAAHSTLKPNPSEFIGDDRRVLASLSKHNDGPSEAVNLLSSCPEEHMHTHTHTQNTHAYVCMPGTTVIHLNLPLWALRSTEWK